MFGTNVQFTYRGQDYYTTNCGRVTTFFAVAAYITLGCLKFIEFFGSTDDIEYVAIKGRDMTESIDLRELGFNFAVEDLDPKYGTIEAYQVKWNGQSGVKNEELITLEPCDSFDGQGLSLSNSYKSQRDLLKEGRVTSYQCPSSDS